MKTVDFLKALGGVICVAAACNVYAQTSDADMASGAAATTSAPSAKMTKQENRKLGRQVRIALSKSKEGIDVSKIDVRARGGAVTLSGTVPDQSQIDAATAAAKSVPGVTSVSNKLSVKEQ
jgi:hyperosmotically inducible protein